MTRTLQLLAAIFLTTLACGNNDNEVVRWDMHVAWPEDNYHTEGARQFAALVKERSDGRLVITVRPNGELGLTGTEVLDAVAAGSPPIADNFMENAAAQEPLFGLFALPLAETYAEARELEDIARPYFQDALDRHGQVLLYTSPWAPQGLFTTDPVESPEDFADLRVRTAGVYLTRFVEELGATAVTIPFADLDAALDRGDVNAVLTSPTTGVDARLWERTSVFRPALVPNIPLNYVSVNRSAFDRLPEDLRQVVRKAAAEVGTDLWTEAPQRQQEATTRLEAEGMQVDTEVPPALAADIEAAAVPVISEWQAQAGPEGEEILREFRGN